ncbi:MAG: chemotaxis protein CheX [Lachnospiraceae bacterium]|nr:chemotaxis protein CheX [Lachnospiraceae bacterium]
MNAEYINPFLMASTKVLKDFVMIDAKVGKPYLKTTEFGDNLLLIMLGITGQIKGQVILEFNHGVALDIASKMCMMQMDELNELSQSAISELCNMILGNTATVFSNNGVVIDITPPTLCNGPVTFSNSFATNICVPLVYDENKVIEINIALAS